MSERIMTDESPIDIVLGRLKAVMPSGDSGRQWSACCPAHADAHQSLGIGLGREDTVLLKCYAGCDTKAIVAALGLEMRDLFRGRKEKVVKSSVTVGALAFDKRLPTAFLTGVCGLRDEIDGDQRRVLIPYKDEAGKTLFSRVRSALKAKEGTKQPKGTKIQAYGRWRLPAYRQAGSVLILVEGESDAWTLWYHDYPALGVPGADAVKGVVGTDLDGFDTVYIWRDGKTKADDASGEHFVVRMTARVRELRPGATVRMICSDDAKDPNEIQQRFAAEFKARFEAILANAGDPPVAAEAATGPKHFPLTDYGNAQRLVFREGKDLRFALDKWLVWDSKRWRQDKTGEVIRRVKNMVRSIPTELPPDAPKDARKKLSDHAFASESGRAIRETARLAESEPGVAVDPSELDGDAFLFNCQNGTIDLRTGEIRPHRREDLLTKISPVDFASDARCPEWEKFLSRVFSSDPDNPAAPGDPEVIGFVQRLCGYCLTGDIREQVLPILWGGGSNGKSTFLNVLRWIFGKGYYAKAPRGLLMARKVESHPTELTILDGARLVVSTESAQDARLSEDLVKDLTGGEAITARHMREDFYEFDPTHKLFHCTNHQPRIAETDDGIWRRVILVAFRVKFWNPDKGEVGPEHLKQDKGLSDRLRQELPGILAWIVRGCLEWQRTGLRAPKTVQEETAAYREDEDQIAHFLSECCLVSNSAGNTLLKDVYAKFTHWCDENGYRAGSNRRLKAGLISRGIVVKPGTANKVTCFGLAVAAKQSACRRVSSLDDLDDDEG